jgi:hypothetical protein
LDHGNSVQPHQALVEAVHAAAEATRQDHAGYVSFRPGHRFFDVFMAGDYSVTAGWLPVVTGGRKFH